MNGNVALAAVRSSATANSRRAGRLATTAPATDRPATGMRHFYKLRFSDENLKMAVSFLSSGESVLAGARHAGGGRRER